MYNESIMNKLDQQQFEKQMVQFARIKASEFMAEMRKSLSIKTTNKNLLYNKKRKTLIFSQSNCNLTVKIRSTIYSK